MIKIFSFIPFGQVNPYYCQLSRGRLYKMAAPIEVVGMFSSKVTFYNRITFRYFKQAIRSCHVSVQDGNHSLAEPARSQFSVPPPTIGKSAKSLQNRLLSHGISSAMTARPLGIVRPYSVLPQREIYTTPFLHDEESTSTSTSKRKCWKCGAETDALTELFFCHCGVVQSPAVEVTFFTLFKIDESFDVDLKKLSEMYKDLQKHLHPDMYSQKSQVRASVHTTNTMLFCLSVCCS